MPGIAGIARAVFSGFLMSSPALADALPKTATPMSSEAVTKLFQGNSAIWKDEDIYFAPDGSVKGIFGKPTVKALIVGSWSVNDNELCVYTFRSKEKDPFRDCYQYWSDKKRIITLWSMHSDDSAPDQDNGYYFGEEKKLKPGDLVTDRYTAAPPM